MKQKINQCTVIFDKEKFEVRIKKDVPENFGVTEFAKLSVKIFEDYYSTLEPLSLKDNHSEIDFLKLETDATTFLILDYLGLEDTSYDFDYLDNLKQPLISKQKLLLKSFLTRVQHRKNNFISVYEKEHNQIISSENEREKNENSITKEIEMSKEKMNRLSKLREKEPELSIQSVVESSQNYDVPEQELVLEKSAENEE